MSDRIAVINKGRVVQLDGPQDLYEKPRTQFVANFIGESYSLPVDISAGKASLFGRLLHLAAAPANPAKSQILVLRPEKLRLVENDAGQSENVVAGEVRQSVFQGDSVVTYVTLAQGHEIAVRQPHRASRVLPKAGSAVEIGFSLEDTIIVPKDADAHLTAAASCTSGWCSIR